MRHSVGVLLLSAKALSTHASQLDQHQVEFFRAGRDQPDYTNSGCLTLLAIVGNSNRKIEPPFAPGDTQIRPSWFSMIDWQIERPIPIPRALVVNIGLKSRSACVYRKLKLGHIGDAGPREVHVT